MLIYAACVYVAVKWFRVDKEIGLIKASSKEWLIWLPPLVVPAVLAFQLRFHSTWSHVPFLLIAAIGVAVNEEILFRGILLRSLLPFGSAVAIVLPAFFFGATHLGNILVGGDVSFGLIQFGWTSLTRIALAALRLQNKSLLPAIGCHIMCYAT